MADNCYRCGRPGHWAADCDRQLCGKCRLPADWHTTTGLVECAWRGGPCSTCGYPPHPDYATGRCDRYCHPGDTREAREIRYSTAWHRDDDRECYARPRR